jgi:hypothetical protein
VSSTKERTNAITAHSQQVGRFEELRKLRDAQDLAAAESRLKSATDTRAEMPVPDRIVTEAEVEAARGAKKTRRMSKTGRGKSKISERAARLRGGT